MKIAITTWGNRVSPVFDAAKTLLIADIENQSIHSKKYEVF
jgi:predicted Fe-Mo cluster-binding NifX family protein